MPSSLRNRVLLAALLALGFALMALQADSRRGFTMGDPVEYANEAWIIVNGPQPQTWPARTKRPILMPTILACAIQLFGSLFWMRLTVALFGTVTVWLTYLLAARLIDEDAGLMAAAILVTNPLWSSMSSQLFSEIPAAFFIMLCLVLLSGVRRPRSLFGAGVAFGASILVRYQSTVMLIPLGVLLLWQFKRRQVVAFAIGLTMMLVLQGFHDLMVYGHFAGSLMSTLSVDLSGLAGLHYGDGTPWWSAGHPPWWYYLRGLHRWLTYVGPFALVIGGWTICRGGSRFGMLLLLLPLVLTFGVLSANAHKELRYLVIITPLAAICCGAALHFPRVANGGLRASIPLIIVLLAPPLQGSYQISSQEWTRFYTGQADALRFIENTHPGAVVATPTWSVCLPERRGQLRLLDLRLDKSSNIGPRLPKCNFVLLTARQIRQSDLEQRLLLRFKEVKRFPSRNETYLLYGVR